MDNITIPPDAIEAAARAQYAAWVKLESAATGMHVGDFEWWEGLGKDSQDEWLQQARAACLAMLKAWPGSYSLAENDSAEIRDVAVIILPLTENTNAEA